MQDARLRPDTPHLPVTGLGCPGREATQQAAGQSWSLRARDGTVKGLSGPNMKG